MRNIGLKNNNDEQVRGFGAVGLPPNFEDLVDNTYLLPMKSDLGG